MVIRFIFSAEPACLACFICFLPGCGARILAEIYADPKYSVLDSGQPLRGFRNDVSGAVSE